MWKDEDESDDEAGAGPGVPGDMGDMSSVGFFLILFLVTVSSVSFESSSCLCLHLQLMQQFNAGGMNFDMPSGGMDDDEGPDSDDDGLNYQNFTLTLCCLFNVLPPLK